MLIVSAILITILELSSVRQMTFCVLKINLLTQPWAYVDSQVLDLVEKLDPGQSGK